MTAPHTDFGARFARGSLGGGARAGFMAKDKRPGGRSSGSVRHLFHGVSIKPGERSCGAVRALEGRRFLSDEAPRVPLPNCECRDACRCVYQHYTDRRTDVRRDADIGLPSRHVDVDRRVRYRRVTDRRG